MQEIAQKFKALGDPTRLRILNLLLQGELCVCDIQRVLVMSQPLVSRHLFYLKSAGLVRDRRDGYRVFYALVDSNKSLHSILFRVLRDVFAGQESMQDDLCSLRQAVKKGACQIIPRRTSPEKTRSTLPARRPIDSRR